jgi:hydrogenase/urease accessory protein HupE
VTGGAHRLGRVSWGRGPTAALVRAGSAAKQRLAFCLVLASVLFAQGLGAHELQPGFLELKEVAPGRYETLWKQPSVGAERMRITPVFPEQCRQVGEARTERSGTAWLTRARVECDRGLAGQPLAMEGLEAFSTDVLVRLEHLDGAVETHVLKPVDPVVTLRAAGDSARGIGAYLYLGIEHILLGVDHLLFVLGLLLIVADRWMLVKTITAFTLAHSITLAVATLGIAQVSPAPLNVAIALSILFLGPEIVRTWRGETSLSIRHPWVVAFGFGLLHGFGFASGLKALGLPQGEIPLALLLFNLGVEIGQLAFVILVLLLLRAFRILEIHWPRAIQRLPGYLVGTMGAYWTFQRLAILLRGVL